MLGFPKYGWTDVHLQDDTGLTFDAPASYLTSVHLDTLNAFTNFYKTHNPQSIYYDAEGWDYIVVLDWCNVYVIENKDESKLYNFCLDIDELGNQVISDIENAFEDWADFCFYGYREDLEKHRNENQEELINALNELKQAKKDFNKRYNRISN